MPHPRRRGRPPHDDVLTQAEWRVVEGVRHGMTNPAIARRLGVTTEAVKYHMANALPKLGLANRAALRHWHGVRRDSAMFGKAVPMETDYTLGPLAQIARSVTDIEAAREWYGQVLRLPHLYSFGTLAFYDCGGVRLMLSQGPAAAESILYFRVGDVRPAAAALQARGVAFRSAPHMVHRHQDGTEEWLAVFDDHEGRPLALMAQVGGGAIE